MGIARMYGYDLLAPAWLDKSTIVLSIYGLIILVGLFYEEIRHVLERLDSWIKREKK